MENTRGFEREKGRLTTRNPKVHAPRDNKRPHPMEPQRVRRLPGGEARRRGAEPARTDKAPADPRCFGRVLRRGRRGGRCFFVWREFGGAHLRCFHSGGWLVLSRGFAVNFVGCGVDQGRYLCCAATSDEAGIAVSYRSGVVIVRSYRIPKLHYPVFVSFTKQKFTNKPRNKTSKAQQKKITVEWKRSPIVAQQSQLAPPSPKPFSLQTLGVPLPCTHVMGVRAKLFCKRRATGASHDGASHGFRLPCSPPPPAPPEVPGLCRLRGG